MNKRFLLITLLCLLLAGLISLRLIKFKTKPRTNLILITVDALNAQHLGIYGYPNKTSPNIDKYFKNSYIFTKAYTTTPKTYSSVVSIMTGLSPSTTKIFDYIGRPLRDTEKTLSGYLKEKGYHNAGYIMNLSLILSNREVATGLEKDFETFRYLAPVEQVGKNAFFSHRESVDFVDEGIEFIKKNATEPFFVWYHLIDPHAPYSPPKSALDKYLMAKQREKYRGLSTGCYNPKTPPNYLISELTDLYDQEIEFSDSLVKRIFVTLKERGIDDNTVVVLTADHGEGFDHNYYFHHGALYESNVQIPLLIKVPGKTGKRLSTAVLNYDFTPTFLDLLGIKYNQKNLDGLSLIPLMNPTAKSNLQQYQRDIFGYNHFKNYFSILSGHNKYFFSTKNDCLYSGENEEFYNLESDPQELNPILTDNPEKTALKTKLFEHLSTKKIAKPQ